MSTISMNCMYLQENTGSGYNNVVWSDTKYNVEIEPRERYTTVQIKSILTPWRLSLSSLNSNWTTLSHRKCKCLGSTYTTPTNLETNIVNVFFCDLQS